jgi:hypothetical protein
VLYRPPARPQQDFRHYCRNPRCRSKLSEPTSITRDAFCARGCYLGFYRTRCVVCEEKFECKNEREKVCGRRKCQAAFKGDRARFLSSRYPYGPDVLETLRSAHFTGLKTPTLDRPSWRIIAGPSLPPANLRISSDPEFADRLQRARANLIESARKAGRLALVQPHHPPTNVLGGHKFAGAPEIDLSPIEPAAAAATSSPAVRALVATIPADLSIPNF